MRTETNFTSGWSTFYSTDDNDGDGNDDDDYDNDGGDGGDGYN